MKNFSLAILFISLFLGNEQNIRTNTILFCIKPNYDNLNIVYRNNNFDTNYEELNSLFRTINVLDIKPWLPGAIESDYSNDIYLDKIYRITFDQRSIPELNNIRENLENLDFIHSSEYEYLRQPLYTPNDQYYNNQWFLPAINSNDAWDIWINNGETPGDRGVLLASVDLGVNYKHNDLRNNIWQNLNEDADGDGHTIEYSGGQWILDPGDLNGIDDDDWDNNSNTFIDDLVGWDISGLNGVDDNDPDPPHTNAWSHGTHVAGLLSATTDNNIGIASTAFNCSIMAVKVSDENQTGQIYITDGFGGILYAAKAGYYAEGFTIINNSWGGIGYSQYEQATINVCFNDYNSIIVCAGGNGSTSGWGEAYEIQYPSGYENVVAVAPLGQNNQWNHWGTYHETIDLSSPGESIRSTTANGYSSWDGSSMASPVAASVFGLLKSYNPTWDNEKIQTMVLGTADPIIYTVNSESYLQGRLGTGRVDTYAALTTPLFPKIEYVGEDLISGGDNIINSGEEAEIYIILFNNPEWGLATNLQATLTEDNPYVNVINSTIDYGDIPPGEAMITEPFIIQFGSNLSNVDINFDLNITSNENGYVQYNSTIPLSYFVEETAVLIGDLNQDEIINILDIVYLVNIILGSDPGNSYALQAGDINQDGFNNIQDIVLLLNMILN